MYLIMFSNNKLGEPRSREPRFPYDPSKGNLGSPLTPPLYSSLLFYLLEEGS